MAIKHKFTSPKSDLPDATKVQPSDWNDDHEGGIVAISGSNSSLFASTISFGNSNGLSFYVTNGSMVASHDALTSQSSEPRVISFNGTSGGLSLYGASNITVSNNGTAITLHGPANILNSFSISGNSGTTGSSNISGGGFVIAGGNNITLSQSNNSISIIGGGGGAAGTNTFSVSGSNSISGTNVQIVFSAGTNVTLNQTTNGASMTMAVVAPANILNSFSIGGNTGTTNSSAISGGGFILAGGSNVTLSQSNNSISIHAATDMLTTAMLSNAGSNFVNTNAGLNLTSISATFSSNSIYLSVGAYITTAANSTHSHGNPVLNLTNLAGTTGSASNGLTISLSATAVPSNILNSFSIGGNTGTTNSSAISGGGFVFAGGSNVTLSQSNNTISIHAQSDSAQPRVISMNGTSGNMSLYGASNVTVSNNGSAITLHGPSNILNSFSIGGNTGTTNSSAISGGGFVFAGGSNITLSQSNNTISIHAQSDSVQPRVISFNGTSGSLSLSGASNITVSALNVSTITIYGPANILNSFSIGGNTGTTNSSAISGGGFVIAGGNNITLSQSNNTISIIGGGGVGAGIGALGNTVATNTFTSGTVIFSGLANMTINTSVNGASQYIQFSAPDGGVGGGFTKSIKLLNEDIVGFNSGTSVSSNGTQYFFTPFHMDNPISISNIWYIKSFNPGTGTSSNSSGRQSYSYEHSAYIFRRFDYAGSSNSLTYHTSCSFGFYMSRSHTSNNNSITAAWVTNSTGGTSTWSTASAGNNWSSYFTGMKFIAIPLVTSLSAGEWFIANRHSSTTATVQSNLTILSVSALMWTLLTQLTVRPLFNTNSTLSNIFQGIGFGSATAITTNAAMNATAISAGGSLQMPHGLIVNMAWS